MATQRKRLNLRAAIASAAMLLGTVSVGAVAVLVAGPAYAQVALTPAQQMQAQTAIQNAINAVNMQNFATNEAKQEAMENALAGVELQLIMSFGSGYTESITSLMVSVSTMGGVPPATLGGALASAADQLMDTDPVAARAIAQTVNSTGIAALTGSFVTAINGLNGATVLIEIAEGAGVKIPACANPSCT